MKIIVYDRKSMITLYADTVNGKHCTVAMLHKTFMYQIINCFVSSFNLGYKN